MAASGRSALRRTGRVLTGFAALVVLCAVVVGGPVALLALAGNPLPDHVPTVAEIGATLTSRDDGRLFLRALALAGWFGWATFTLSVLVELAAQALRRPAPRLPGMSRQQRAAAALVGSVALIVAAAPAASAATATMQPYAQPAAVAPLVPASVPPSAPEAAWYSIASPALPPGASESGALPPGAGGSGAGGSGSRAPVAGAPVYRVAKGDYLGAVAERYLGEFADYRELARLNRLDDPDRIRPGQLLKLPAQASDRGARPHATGRLVARPTRPGHPTPGQVAPGQPNPGQAGAGQQTAAPTTPGRATQGKAGSDRAAPGSAETTRERPGVAPPAAEAPGGAPVTVGAARAGEPDRMNRPLAVSAVLAVASIVGAQIGAVLGLRRRPATGRGRTGAQASAGELPVGRHRRD
ncbi:LysM peptidoglycan-binding domain-containing protein [Micromonospora sp. C28SCA-DRY-2]|uniref:LysM peptidoglycan-binding domain-containing protein n=1 Tax=Micromonospora sp. C28SCA-DRY-2 TaxID=3059522 RepID=UPI002676ECE8|nr:LysM peptidoglycan-binding domain-containing protein [Micromonospora sp. C28SCA-DRY-2]MDO3704005.1 LysM peptidoglycan-binding domain-containing protein [Micromonospora sp. C28SCA-DRY-2]